MSFLGTLRKLILGETRALPLGVAAAVALSGLLRLLAGPDGWWRHDGGWVLAGLLVLAVLGALPRRN